MGARDIEPYYRSGHGRKIQTTWYDEELHRWRTWVDGPYHDFEKAPNRRRADHIASCKTKEGSGNSGGWKINGISGMAGSAGFSGTYEGGLCS